MTSALWLLCLEGKSEESLIKAFKKYKRSDIDAADEFGNTALICACRKGYERFAELLIENNANTTRKNDEGEDALYWAKIGGMKNEIIAILEEKKKERNRGFYKRSLTAAKSIFRRKTPSTDSVRMGGKTSKRRKTKKATRKNRV